MKLYNTLSRKVEEFQPENPERVKVYTCGPTVYNTAHIGNFTAYVYWDLLIRVLRLNGWHEDRVLNITDVGHLASDADEGEDKMEKGAKREGLTVWQIAERYMNEFLADYRALNLLEPTQICRATDFISEEMALVDALDAKGLIYETSDGLKSEMFQILRSGSGCMTERNMRCNGNTVGEWAIQGGTWSVRQFCTSD